MDSNWILVNKPFLPPIEEFSRRLKGIWDRNYLTNNGPLLQELEANLTSYLGLNHISVVTNGTISLQIALQTLVPKGKILTTPFSYIATVSSIVWEGYEPVFIDIEADTFNVNAGLIESKIDEETTGMLFTHTFGVPCDLEVIDHIARKYNLPVIYDAAHAFGVKFKGSSVLNFGSASSLSFHATKLFHMTEGGALVSNSEDVKKEVELRRNFGHNGPEVFDAVGINGKNSEIHAAMGLTNLQYIDEILTQRKRLYLHYLACLSSANISFQKWSDGVEYNYSYMPVVFESEEVLLRVKAGLESNQISPRRYFYPSLNTLEIFSAYHVPCPVSESIASRILCLPIYHDLSCEEIDRICGIVRSCLESA